MRLASRMDFSQLRHQHFVDVQPTGSVKDHNVVAVLRCVLDAATTDLGRSGSYRLRIDRNAELLAKAL